MRMIKVLFAKVSEKMTDHPLDKIDEMGNENEDVGPSRVSALSLFQLLQARV